MEMLRVAITALVSIVLLFILTKIMGNRQMSQLSLFDYINGITIGSIASEMAIAPEDFKKPMIAMIVYALITTLISIITCKSAKLRMFITGRPLVLYENGKFFAKNMLKAKLDANEFLTQSRTVGFFNLNNIHTAILEPNGKISFVPMSNQRPAVPADFNLSPTQDVPQANVIIDGKMIKKNLQAVGIGEAWLQNQLKTQEIKDISEVFLATCNTEQTISVFTKLGSKAGGDKLG